MGETHNELTGDVHGVVYQARNMTFLSERSTPALSGLPRPEPDFTGREAQLADQLRPDRETGAVVVSAVAGLGGVGKRHLGEQAFAMLTEGGHAENAQRTRAWLDEL